MTVEESKSKVAANAVPVWGIGPFERVDEANPIIKPQDTLFDCPMTGGPVAWESDHTFNPTAVVKDGRVCLLYRAEDNTGDKIGYHTSRVGLAVSSDGRRFERRPAPVVYPQHDSQEADEWPGGCEDPRVVAAEDGRFILTYSQWNRKNCRLGVASSPDLEHWTKHGSVFADAYDGKFSQIWSKSGSIVTKLTNDGTLAAARIDGKYWMYWGDSGVYIAHSDDLIAWTPVLGDDGEPLAVLSTRPHCFDSGICEPGPAAVLTDAGIVLLYNGMNSLGDMADAVDALVPGPKSDCCPDPELALGAYSAGQALFDADDPTRLLDRSKGYFLTPERPYEVHGQYDNGGTVFIQGLARFNDEWLLYYGCADSFVAVATAPA